MRINAYAFLDAKTGCFTTPFFMLHHGQAVRAAMELGQDLNTTVGRHPADFHLHVIGTFDDQTGVLEASKLENLGSVVSMIPQQQQLPVEIMRPGTEVKGF